MKVIDLLNKIANGEEVPNKIQYDYKIFYYDGIKYVYDNDVFNEYNRLEEFISYSTDLNKEIKFSEEDKEIEDKCKNLFELCEKMLEEDKEIEEAKLKLFEDTGEAVTFSRVQECNEFNIKELKRVTDELIKAVNELKKGK